MDRIYRINNNIINVKRIIDNLKCHSELVSESTDKRVRATYLIYL